MSNNNRCIGESKEANEVCDTHLAMENRANSLSMNRQKSTIQNSIERSASSSRQRTYANDSFNNGDLIDLCDQMNEREQLNGSSCDLVEAINGQLLADVCGKSQTPANGCHLLYPTKVSSDNKIQISGITKSKHTNKLQNSIDLSNSTATLSTESIGKCCESGNSTTTNEQHQTVIREFKRIGTYCTLRPEQRRKHLLKVLPTLRNSMLLQTLFGANTTPKHLSKTTTTATTAVADLPIITNKDIDSLLIDLDDFIIDGNTALMQKRSNETLNSNESFTLNCENRSQRSSNIDAGTTTPIVSSRYPAANSTELNKNCIQIDPDKVEDCLLELDAYLEEIDRDYVLACAAHGPTTTIATTQSSTASSNGVVNHNSTASHTNNAKSMRISAHLINECSKKTSKNHIDPRRRQLLLNTDHFLDDGDDDDYDNDNDDACISGDPLPQNDHLLLNNCNSDTQVIRVPPNLRKQISNSDIQMNQCGESIESTEINGSRHSDNKRKFNDFSADDQPLKRGHKLRNTVAGSGHNNHRQIASSKSAPFQSVDNSPKKMRSKNMALSWRRLSMRKTCPIDLPEQHLSKDAMQNAFRTVHSPRSSSSTANRSNTIATEFASNTNQTTDFNVSNTDENNDNYCFNETMMPSTITSTNAALLLHSENNDTPMISERPREHVLSNEYDTSNQLPELSSLNNEFLNTILATPNFQQSVTTANTNTNSLQHESNFVHNHIEEDSDCATAFEDSRPRQWGRRSEMRSRILSITAECNAEGNQRIIVNCDRDNVPCATQPSCSTTTMPTMPTPPPNQSIQPQSTLQRLSTQCQFTASEASSGASSRNPSPVSIASSTESSSGGSTSAGETNIRSTPHRTVNMSGNTETSAPNRNSSSTSQRQMNSKTTVWPFGFSRVFAATCCTLGLFNISRFSIFSIIFGANFIVQFLLLSLFLGVPMLWLQMCLGANIKGGPISMWRVSPICKGIGIALVLVQALMTIYSAVSIAWMLIYLRDSCVSARYPWYRWQEIFEFFRGPSDNGIAVMSNTSEPSSTSSKLGETVADYFNGVILQRYQLGPGGRASNGNGIGAVRFQLAFNLSVVWLIIFVVLCKGLRLYGKVVVALVMVPMLSFFVLTTKMLTLLNLAGFQNIFPATDWQDFFLNSQSWLSAAQEAFLTWTLLGASIISIFSKSSKYQQEGDKALRRDALLVVAFTLIGLLLAAIFGNACVQILNDRGFYYFPGSFETITSSVFLLPSSKPLPPQLATSLSKWLPRYSTLLGESYKRIDPNTFESGWQPLRLITEIFPATLAAATLDNIPTFWSLLGFCTFLCYGLAQLCAMWKPIATSLCNYSESISATSTTILLTCLAGLLLGIPLTTECGINIIYFLDSVIGGAWFVLLLWTGQIFAVFLVRGRPYSGDMLVNRLHLGLTFSAFVALSWNLLLPIGLLTLCVLQYKISYSYDFYHWSGIISQSYWPIWTRKAAAFIQIGIFQIIPITAIAQTYRYLSKGPPDILDRFQLLYRPPISSSQRSHRYPLPRSDRSTHAASNNRQSENTSGSSSIPAIAVTLESNALSLDDAPPKYTPPPSYTTATGARIAKLLRNSIRRSVRRILGEPNCSNRRQRVALQTVESSFDQNPPEYSTIISSSLATTSNHDSSTPQNNNYGPTVFNNDTYRHHITNTRRHTTTNFPSPKSLKKIDSFSLTMPRRQSTAISSTSNERCNFRNLTAHDVAQLLRSTTQNTQHNESLSDTSPHSIDNTTFPIDSVCIINSDDRCDIGQEHEDYSLTRSVEELVLNEVPVGESSAAATFCDKS